ncbi:MAG: hypothetical protein RI973_2235 [Bacteroidota bacterium]|jgi:type IX secretion system PorP/SprF family membrane protein
MRSLFTLAIWLLAIAGISAQDFHFVNSFQAQQLINPAATGASSINRTQIATLYRGQWDNAISEHSYQGAAVLADMRFCLQRSRKSFYALGIGIQHDFSPLGGLYNSIGMFNAAYHQHLGNEVFAAVGASLGGFVFGIQPGNLKFDAQFQQGYFDSGRSNGEDFLRQAIAQPDMGAGGVVYNNLEGWSAGISWRHINKPLYSLLEDDNRLGIGLVVHGSYALWKTNSRSRMVQIRALYRRQSMTGSNSMQWQAMSGGFFQAAIGGAMGMRLSLGAYLRAGSTPLNSFMLNTLVPVVQLSRDNFSVVMSYDTDIARTRSRFPGGLELMLAYGFGKTDRCVVCSGF